MEKKKSLVILTISLLIVLGIYSFLSQKTARDIITSVSETAGKISSPKSALPFKEMTIPYLRERVYESQIEELEEYSDNGSYTSYLASYDSDGFKVNGLLTIPKGETPVGGWPAVVFVHGYIPPASYNTTSQYSDYVDYLARSGLVVFKIDLRGHGSSEGEAGGGYFSSDYIIDVLNARSALASSDFVNPDGVGLWGHSMAGNVVTRAFAASPEIKGVVVFSGAVYTYEDMRQFGINDNSYQPPSSTSQRAGRRQALFDTVGSPSAQSDFWRNVAFTGFLNDLKGELEIHHAVDDPVVSIEYSRNLMSIMDGSSVPHRLHEYPTGGHNLTGASFNLAMQRTADFFLRVLK